MLNNRARVVPSSNEVDCSNKQFENRINASEAFIMSVPLSSIAPRFVLPRISNRVTAVRPARIAALSTSAVANHEYREAQSTRHNQTQRAYQPRKPVTQCLLAKRASQPLPLASRRAFSATSSRFRNHHFDTLKFVQKLKDEGFTEDQAVSLMKVLNDVIEERLD